jgi:hypothetical protein
MSFNRTILLPRDLQLRTGRLRKRNQPRGNLFLPRYARNYDLSFWLQGMISLVVRQISVSLAAVKGAFPFDFEKS